VPAPANVRIAGRTYIPGADRGVAVLLTAASWLLQRLPGQVVERQRGELIRTLQQSQDLSVVIQCGPAPAVRVYDGARLLVEIPGEAQSANIPVAATAVPLAVLEALADRVADRRYMRRGAMAMAVAKILDSKHCEDGGEAPREAGVSHARVSQRRKCFICNTCVARPG
jgi:hypothetical protein